MYCEKCGNFLVNGELYCRSCGRRASQPVVPASQPRRVTTYPAPAPSQPKNPSLAKAFIIIIFAAVILTSTLLIPCWNTWGGGLMPDEYALTFGDVMELLGEDNWYGIFPVVITLISLLTGGLMLLSGILKKRSFAISVCATGLALMSLLLFQIMGQNGADFIFDFEDCGVTIGVWINFFMILGGMIVSIANPGGEEDAPIYKKPPLVTPPATENAHHPGRAKVMKQCRHCGCMNDSAKMFCAQCGERIG